MVMRGLRRKAVRRNARTGVSAGQIDTRSTLVVRRCRSRPVSGPLVERWDDGRADERDLWPSTRRPTGSDVGIRPTRGFHVKLAAWHKSLAYDVVQSWSHNSGWAGNNLVRGGAAAPNVSPAANQPQLAPCLAGTSLRRPHQLASGVAVSLAQAELIRS